MGRSMLRWRAASASSPLIGFGFTVTRDMTVRTYPWGGEHLFYGAEGGLCRVAEADERFRIELGKVGGA